MLIQKNLFPDSINILTKGDLESNSLPPITSLGTSEKEKAEVLIQESGATIQKQFDALAAQNEFNYKQLLEAIPAAVYTCDEVGRITMFNRAAVELWGRTPEIGKDMWCGSWKIYSLDGELLPLDECPMALTLKEKRPVNGKEIIIERPDGVRINILPHPSPLFDQSGNLIGAVNMLVDISWRKEAEDALRESEEKFREMANMIPQIIWTSGPDGVLDYCNLQWYNYTGFSAGRENEDLLPLLHPADVERYREAFSNSIKNGENFQLEYRLRDRKNPGRYRWFLGRALPLRDRNKKIIRWFGTCTEIHDTKMAAENLGEIVRKKTGLLKESEERYHKMIDEVQEYAIILLDKNGIIQNWNKGAQKIKGYKEEEAVGKSFKIFYTKEDQERHLPEKILNDALVQGRAIHEGWRVRKNNSVFWGSIVITALHDEQNEIIGFSKVTRDLTDRKAAEDKLKEHAKELESQNRELEEFAYIASHDLQEPLRKIKTFSDRLKEKGAPLLDDVSKTYLDKIINSSDRMSLLIKDVLNYSQLTHLEEKFITIDLNEILKNVLCDFELRIEQTHATIEAENLPVLRALPLQMNQLFHNLLSNGLKFTRVGIDPMIKISSRLLPVNEIVVHSLDPKLEYFEIIFQDNGIGFSKEHENSIFKIFHRLSNNQNKYEGTGIGLALCRKIISIHHGEIFAVSVENEGTSIHVILPSGFNSSLV